MPTALPYLANMTMVLTFGAVRVMLSRFRSRKPRLTPGQIPAVVTDIALGLEVAREQFLFGAISGLKESRIDLAGVSPLLEKGTELDAALRGFQLVAVVGFAWRYIDLPLCETFDEGLSQRLDNGHAGAINGYREKYLDCQGDAHLLTQCLAADVHRLWGGPEPRQRVLSALAETAMVLAILSQAKVAGAIGDRRTERRLVQVAGGNG